MISFLTPTYMRPQLLRNAIESLLAQTNPDWEMLISPDDGQDYSALTLIDPRIRVVDAGGAVRTGPGAARNRALSQATGDFVTCLDDDDTLAENFVEACLISLIGCDAVFTPSAYVTEDNTVVRVIGADLTELNIDAFSQQYGSMHAIIRREMAPRWFCYFSQDVLHTCCSLDLVGGTAKIVQNTQYRITITSNSVCTSKSDIDQKYEQILQDIDKAGLLSEMSPAALKKTRTLFAMRQETNKRYEQQMKSGLGYHEFILSTS